MKVEDGGKLFFQFFSNFFEQADATYSEHDLRAQQRIPFNKVEPRMPKRMSSPAIVGRLCQSRKHSGFTERSGGDASDTDGKPEG